MSRLSDSSFTAADGTEYQYNTGTSSSGTILPLPNHVVDFTFEDPLLAKYDFNTDEVTPYGIDWNFNAYTELHLTLTDGIKSTFGSNSTATNAAYVTPIAFAKDAIGSYIKFKIKRTANMYVGFIDDPQDTINGLTGTPGIVGNSLTSLSMDATFAGNYIEATQYVYVELIDNVGTPTFQMTVRNDSDDAVTYTHTVTVSTTAAPGGLRFAITMFDKDDVFYEIESSQATQVTISNKHVDGLYSGDIEAGSPSIVPEIASPATDGYTDNNVGTLSATTPIFTTQDTWGVVAGGSMIPDVVADIEMGNGAGDAWRWEGWVWSNTTANVQLLLKGGIRVYIGPGWGGIRIYDDNGGGTVFDGTTADTALIDGNWHYYSLDWDGTTLRMHADGVLEGSTTDFEGDTINGTEIETPSTFGAGANTLYHFDVRFTNSSLYTDASYTPPTAAGTLGTSEFLIGTEIFHKGTPVINNDPYTLDVTNGQVNLGQIADIGSAGDFTITGKVKTDAPADTAIISRKGTNGLDITTSKVEITGATATVFTNVPATINDNTWKFFAATFNSTTNALKYYVDTNSSTTTADPGAFSNTSNLILGANTSDAMLLEDLRFYNKELSASDREQLRLADETFESNSSFIEINGTKINVNSATTLASLQSGVEAIVGAGNYTVTEPTAGTFNIEFEGTLAKQSQSVSVSGNIPKFGAESLSTTSTGGDSSGGLVFDTGNTDPKIIEVLQDNSIVTAIPDTTSNSVDEVIQFFLGVTLDWTSPSHAGTFSIVNGLVTKIGAFSMSWYPTPGSANAPLVAGDYFFLSYNGGGIQITLEDLGGGNPSSASSAVEENPYEGGMLHKITIPEGKETGNNIYGTLVYFSGGGAQSYRFYNGDPRTNITKYTNITNSDQIEIEVSDDEQTVTVNLDQEGTFYSLDTASTDYQNAFQNVWGWSNIDFTEITPAWSAIDGVFTHDSVATGGMLDSSNFTTSVDQPIPQDVFYLKTSSDVNSVQMWARLAQFGPDTNISSNITEVDSNWNGGKLWSIDLSSQQYYLDDNNFIYVNASTGTASFQLISGDPTSSPAALNADNISIHVTQ